MLAGGVGAARFLRGLIAVVPGPRVVAVVNTGDDCELHGLAISPDLDTIVYTLAGAIDPERGWGLGGETWDAMTALERYQAVRPADSQAATTWFGLGDRDLATHLYRTARLAEGAAPATVASEIARAWNVDVDLVPMTEGRFRTMIELADGTVVPFQDYFVRLRHGVPVRSVSFDDAGCTLTPTARRALIAATTVVVAPSNPLVSIGPIRALAGVDSILSGRRETVVAISPIVGGRAIKGPADRMLSELGLEPSVVGVARLYAGMASTLVIDHVDADYASEVEAVGMRCVVTQTVMSDPEIARALAVTCLDAVR